jgi:hypothetical protein
MHSLMFCLLFSGSPDMLYSTVALSTLLTHLLHAAASILRLKAAKNVYLQNTLNMFLRTIVEMLVDLVFR